MIVAGAVMILVSHPSQSFVQRRKRSAEPRLAPLRFEMVSFERNETEDKSLMYFTEDADGRPAAGTGCFMASRDEHEWSPPDLVRVRLEMPKGNGGLHHIDNAPAWLESTATTSSRKRVACNGEADGEMLQAFVAERFKLTVHWGSREFPAYASAGQRRRGFGTATDMSQLDCTATPGVSSPCGLAVPSGRLTGRGVTMAQLATYLPKQIAAASRINGRLIDSTGLTGAFDFRARMDTRSRRPSVPATMK